MVNIGLKIKELMRQKNVDAPALAKRMGKTKQAVYAMIEKEDISTSVLRELAGIFDVPLIYFFNEEGAAISVEQNMTGKPFYEDLPVSAGRVIQYPSILNQGSIGIIDLPQTHGAEFFFPVVGMSMKPTINEGEIIGVTHVDRLDTTNADRIYMIVTRDGERMVKRILRYDKEHGTILLGSDNEKYPNTELEVELVLDVYKVVVHLTIETL